MNRNQQINLHEILKRQVLNEEIAQHTQSRPYSEQTFGISDNYLILDSFTKSGASNLEKGEFCWNLQINGTTNTDQKVVGSRYSLDNIIAIELGSFTIPILKEVQYPELTILNSNNIELIQNNSIQNSINLNPVLQINQIPIQAPPNLLITDDNPSNLVPWLNNPLTQTPFDGVITIQVKEAGGQAYNGGHTSEIHHFIYQIQYNNSTTGTSPNAAKAVPMFDKSNLYIFTEPILHFHSISLVFRNPDFPINFEPDIINCKIEVDFTNAIGNNYYLSLKCENHNLLTGDRIYIKNFNSGISNLDYYINSQSGLLVGFEPNLDGSSKRKKTKEVIIDPFFYLDPFITFNRNFKNGNITNFTGNLTSTTNLQINAKIIYLFGQCIISNNINNLSIDPITVSDNFKIGIFSGEYSYTISKIINSSISININNINYYISNIICTITYMQTYNDIYIAKRRMIIPLRLRGVVNKITNYITAI